MIGFIAYVKKHEFKNSNEVDELKWFKMDEIDAMIARDNNFSGMHLDICKNLLGY